MKDVAELPRKAKFRSLDEIKNEENFDVLKQVENKQYNFNTANKQPQIKQLAKNRNIGNLGRQRPSNKVEGEKGPLRPAKDVGTLLKFRKISEFGDGFQETMQSTRKYTYCETTDMIEIKSFFVLFLYLRGTINFSTTDIDIFMNSPTTFSAL